MNTKHTPGPWYVVESGRPENPLNWAISACRQSSFKRTVRPPDA